MLLRSYFSYESYTRDPATLMLGEDADPEDIIAFKEMMKFNDPILKQYIDYVKNVLTGDWGNSLYYKNLYLKS